MIGKTSILDHIYIKDPTLISHLKLTDPFFGDHVLVEFTINASYNETSLVLRRDWRNYSQNLLHTKLAAIDWRIEIDNVQQYWNVFENLLINIIDEIVPRTVQ